MYGLGTIVNVLAIVLGGLAGLFMKNVMTRPMREAVLKGTGVSVLFIGMSGALSRMLVPDGGALSTSGTMLVILSLALGGAAGGLIDIDRRVESFGEWLKKKTGSQNDGGFLDAFVSASLTVCIGAMAVVGSLQDGISGDHATLFAKALLDAIIIMIMAASMGKGALFSAIPVGLFQGSVTLLARFVEPLMTSAATADLSMVGGVLVFCVGVNLVWERRIPVANLLPSVVFAVALSYII